MKRIILITSIFVFTSIASIGQTWKWAKIEPLADDPFPYFLDHIIASDNNGNAYYTRIMLPPPANIEKYDRTGNLVWYDTATCLRCSSSAVATYSGFEYLLGYFESSMIIQSDTVKNRGVEDLFVAKLDSFGIIKWIGRTNNKNPSVFFDNLHSIAADGFGNVYVTGTYGDGTIIAGNDSIHSDTLTPFIMKFDFNGNPKWITGGSPGQPNSYGYSYSIAVDDKGDSYITGYYQGSLVFGNDTLEPTSAGIKENSFLVKFDSAGNVQWTWNAKMLIGSGKSFGAGVATDFSGNAYLAGNFKKGTFSIGTNTFGPVTQITPYFAKFNSSGSVSWAQEVNELDSNAWMATSLSSDTLNNCYILLNCSSGDRLYTLGVGNDTFRLVNSFVTADVLAEFDTSGHVKCGSIFSEGGENDGDNVNVSRSGEYLYLAGDIYGKCGFGADTINGAESFFIASWQPCNKSTEAINEVDKKTKYIGVFPNPNTGQFTLSLSNINEKCSVEIYNVMGERIKSEELRAKSEEIEMSNQPNGIYFYRVIREDGGLIGEGKLIIQK